MQHTLAARKIQLKKEEVLAFEGAQMCKISPTNVIVADVWYISEQDMLTKDRSLTLRRGWLSVAPMSSPKILSLVAVCDSDYSCERTSEKILFQHNQNGGRPPKPAAVLRL